MSNDLTCLDVIYLTFVTDAEDGDTESFVSTIDYSDEEELDTGSSIYDVCVFSPF